MLLSIVIPTYNRSRLLTQTIPALANQLTVEGLTYEVIFVSNGSTDRSEKLLEQAAAQFPGKFKYIRIAPTGGPSAPRNTGIRAASGDVAIILDDDVLPEPDLVLRHAEFHRKYPEEHHAAIGEVYVPESLLHDPMSRFHSFPYDEVRNLDRLSYLHFWTCNISVKRQFMLNRGMFDERFLYYEDIVCGHRLAGNGMHLHFWPSARGQHLHQMTPAGLPAKGLFLGRWLHPLFEVIPDPAAKARLGVLSADLPKLVLARRIVSRAVYRVIDNPLTMAALRMLGATSLTRSPLTDFYYGLIFRRNILAGYREAKRQAAAGRHLNLTQVNSTLADRGDG
jgi:glycosyltransferase involved in cell wall biosynthesis